jgi:hypothetical protein
METHAVTGPGPTQSLDRLAISAGQPHMIARGRGHAVVHRYHEH